MEAMQASRTLKANLKLEGRPCSWCQQALALGEDTSVCTSCAGVHHQKCWDERAGCAGGGCTNAPLRQLEPVVERAFGQAAQPLRPPPEGYIHCPSCRNVIYAASLLCPMCKCIPTPDGLYHGEKTNAPGAVSSLVWGIVGLLFFGIFLGPLAISRANRARAALATGDPSLKGGGLATAGLILGILDLIFFFAMCSMRMQARGQ
jgi:Domain of unknown function (DUF4190)/Prokaryotic RING finger family 1